MIKDAWQLKDYIKNLAKKSNANPQVLLRIYMMERFLERLAISQYNNNIILKGGTLITSMTGVNLRGTMDLDVTIKGISLSITQISSIVKDIIEIDIGDRVSFTMRDIVTIREDAEYSGLRVSLYAVFDKIKMPFQIDFSTGDAITPKAVEYSYKLFFEERSIGLLAYNIETVLAEKLEAILVLNVHNTRMRDYYDIDLLLKLYLDRIDFAVLKTAFRATVRQRESYFLFGQEEDILKLIKNDAFLISNWERYRKQYSYAKDVAWNDVLQSVEKVVAIIEGE